MPRVCVPFIKTFCGTPNCKPAAGTISSCSMAAKKIVPDLHVTAGIGISVLPTVLKIRRFWSHIYCAVYLGLAWFSYLVGPVEVVAGGALILTCPSVLTLDIMLRLHSIHVNKGRNQV